MLKVVLPWRREVDTDLKQTIWQRYLTIKGHTLPTVVGRYESADYNGRDEVAVVWYCNNYSGIDVQIGRSRAIRTVSQARAFLDERMLASGLYLL